MKNDTLAGQTWRMMAQHILPILPAGSTPISATLSVLNDGGRWTYFHGLLPVFSHAAGDTASFRMFTGQLAANGHCKLVEIERAFGVTGISVKRSVKQYREGGCRAFFQKRRPRGPGVLTAEKVAALQGLLDEGVAYAEAARQQGIKPDTVRKGIARGLLRTPKKRGPSRRSSKRPRPATRASEA